MGLGSGGEGNAVPRRMGGEFAWQHVGQEKHGALRSHIR